MSFNPQNLYLKRVGDCYFKPKHRNVNFIKNETTFGRSNSADVALRNERCSINHCKILFENGRMFLDDSSSAGTFVNDVKIRKQKVELFEGTIVGMGADPRRPEHINKTNFYIYQVQKVEAPIELIDSSDDETENLDKIPISSKRFDENGHRESEEEAQDLENGNSEHENGNENDYDSDVTVAMPDHDEQFEDLTLKIEEHLTQPRESLGQIREPSQTQSGTRNQEQLVVLPEDSVIVIKKEVDLNSSMGNFISSMKKHLSKNHSMEEQDAATLEEPVFNQEPVAPLDQQLGSRPSHEHNGLNSMPVGRPKNSIFELTASKLVPESPGSSKSSVSSSSAAPSSSTQGQSPYNGKKSNFGATPSNFVAEPPSSSKSSVTTFSTATSSSNSGLKASNFIAEPVSSSKSSASSSSSSSGSTKPQEIVITSKSAPGSSKLSTSEPKNFEPETSALKISTPRTPTSSGTSKTTPNSTSMQPVSSLVPTTSSQLPQSLRPEFLKAKSDHLRHYGQKGIQFIENIPENNDRTLNQTADLLDEVEGPKENKKIFWKQGVAMVMNERQPRKKRGRPKRNQEARARCDSPESSKSDEMKPGSSNSKDKVIKDEKIDPNENITSNNVKPREFKPTARKKTSNIVMKRPFASINEPLPESEDSSSSEEAGSSNSSSDNEWEAPENSKRQRRNDCEAKENQKVPRERRKSIANGHERQNPKPEHSKNKNSIPTTSEQKVRFPGSESLRLRKKTSESESSSSKSCNETAARKGVPTDQQGVPTERQGASVAPSTSSQNAPMTTKNEQAAQQKGVPIDRQGEPIDRQGVPKVQGAPTTHQGAPTAHQGAPTAHQGAPTAQQGASTVHQGAPTAQPLNYEKFPHLYQSVVPNLNQPEPSPSTSGESAPKPMKKRRQSVFEQQAELIPENLTIKERDVALRRWNQAPVQLVDIPQENPEQRRKGRPRK